MRINKKYDELLQYIESATEGKEITWGHETPGQILFRGKRN